MGELINGRTTEVIKRRLKCASFDCSDINCSDCEYPDICEDVVKRGCAEDALALIEHLEAQQPKWISVKERLPEQGSDVLIRIERDPEVVYYAAAIRNERSRLFDCWDTNDEDFNCGFGHPRVTHWMYITEPPKEENV